MSEKVEETYGCNHYRRKCALIAPCCRKLYTCRLCHDESESHEIDRYKVQQVQCLLCNTKQKVQSTCMKCEASFGKYFCEVCRLYDDEDKKQFHCMGCGICRVGGRDNFFHCTKCDVCLSNSLRDSHKCVEKASRTNCPVCLDDLHTSRRPCDVPKCGHLLHTECLKQMLKSGNYACPLCNESILNMKEVWAELDIEVADTPMPTEYKDLHVQILCRDCHKESKVLFHVIGLKCRACGSYNTCRTAEPDDFKQTATAVTQAAAAATVTAATVTGTSTSLSSSSTASSGSVDRAACPQQSAGSRSPAAAATTTADDGDDGGDANDLHLV